MRSASLLMILAVLVVCSKLNAQEPPVATQPAPTPTTAPAITQEQVLAEIEKLGGKVENHGRGPDGAFLTVIFQFGRRQEVTDAALSHLAVLTHVYSLNVIGCNVTDVGVGYLKNLNHLANLFLSGTKVTDAGLEQLKGLNQLNLLNLYGTKVTDQGVKKLQEALPKSKISR